MSSAKYRRLLLKVSGEMLAGEQGYGIQPSILEGLAQEIASVVALDVQVAVVIGGGNIFRGLAGAAGGMERATADYMGMLATVMNGLALGHAIEKLGVETRVVSAIPISRAFRVICSANARRATGASPTTAGRSGAARGPSWAHPARRSRAASRAPNRPGGNDGHRTDRGARAGCRAQVRGPRGAITAP